MILIFGGTTEGRNAIAVCDEAHKPYYYSTKGTTQEVSMAHGIRLSGAMTAEAMDIFCKENDIRLIVDAAHPFAMQLHQTIADAAQSMQIPVVRYERNYPEQDESLIWCDSYDEAINYLENNNIDDLLALTGVNTIAKLKPYWSKHKCWFRILDRDESREVASASHFPSERILYYRQGEDDTPLLETLKPQAVITKESGESGGFDEKVHAAKQLGIPLLVVRRPALSPYFIPVHGSNGLRKEIERLLPEFFELKTGYTTGTCATVATKAALMYLLTGQKPDKVSITLPNGEWIYINVDNITIDNGAATCCVVKDSGDDPDVTNGKEICSTVNLSVLHKGVRFLQGEGVGTITLPGLGINIGEPAINKTPRMMMKREVFKVLRHYEDKLPNGLKTGVDICISVPNGEEIAKRTFNPKLGIVGGISIIGTSGIVKPFSSEAFIASIKREMQVAKALTCERIVINSGAKSEKFVKQLYPGLSEQAFIHYGNFIGETIKIAAELDFGKLTMGIMLGKAVKLAEGSLDTHSKKGVMNKTFLVQLAREAGCNNDILSQIEQITLARQLWDIIPANNKKFFSLLIAKCHDVCAPLLPNGELTVLLIDEAGGIIY